MKALLKVEKILGIQPTYISPKLTETGGIFPNKNLKLKPAGCT